MSKRKHNTWVVWRRYKKWDARTKPGKWEKWEQMIAIKSCPPGYYSPRDEARKWAVEKFGNWLHTETKVLSEGREPK